MSDATTVRLVELNLLFGALALQREDISPSTLVTAMRAWVVRKNAPLGQVLVEQGVLSTDRRTVLETLVQQHVRQQGNDPARSLAAAPGIAALRTRLAEIADPDLQTALATLRPEDADPYSRFAPQPIWPSVRRSWVEEPVRADLESLSLPSPRGRSRRRNLVAPGAACLLVTVIAVAAGFWLHLQTEEKPHALRELTTEFEREVRAQVNDRIARLLLRDEVLAELRSDPTIPEPVRQAALPLAESYREDPDLLNGTSWALVVRPGATPEECRWALRLADAACRHWVNDGYLLNTLGVAQYRNGKFAEALVTLTRSDELNRARHGDSHPADLAFLAMIHWQLGQQDQAHETLAQLRKTMAAPQWMRYAEGAMLLRETEDVIVGPGALLP